ncbi:MAG TPA: mucoidy inhibitor MuiA family protein [Gemmataceae bacterium]|jgi:uncharacterized protein (TIGR02231 family)|nr:mucoidy inhibitor MuiA family protein [Gemmataceae bacterium]
MWQRSKLRVGAGLAVLTAVAAGAAVTVLPAQERAAGRAGAVAPVPDHKVRPPKGEAPVPPKTAPNRVTGVTVYLTGALVTREVDVPEGTGSFELVVTPLPPQTENNSLYSEGSDGIRVLTTRYRTRPIKEDTREEVRKLDAQKKELETERDKLKSEMEVIKQNMTLLGKLGDFANVNLLHQTDKGTLNSESVMALTKYVMETRGDKAQSLVGLEQKFDDNKEQLAFVERQQQALRSGPSRIEQDAVIVVDKAKPEAGKVRLNYLVDSASWHPQYRFRAGKEKQPIQVEYLAAVMQHTGESWDNARLTLSTAEPLLNAAPPELKMLDVALVPQSAPNPAAQSAAQYDMQAQVLRGQARKEFTGNNAKGGGKLINDAAAVEQAKDLLATREEDLKKNVQDGLRTNIEGPSVTYHLPSRLTIPSRTDEQIIEVARIDLKPDYFYKAVPVLTSHVYRLANLTNTTDYVLLPGEATMYIGTDFVGRATLPLVAIGEQFTAGFGVDPQLQVQRQMMDKTRTTQGDNQVLKFEYRILVTSYKAEPVKLQVWDRLPHAETEAVSVNMVKAKPELSTDGMYLREGRPANLLRWDLTVDPTSNGEKAAAVNYEFKLEMGRQMAIGNLLSK